MKDETQETKLSSQRRCIKGENNFIKLQNLKDKCSI